MPPSPHTQVSKLQSILGEESLPAPRATPLPPGSPATAIDICSQVPAGRSHDAFPASLLPTEGTVTYASSSSALTAPQGSLASSSASGTRAQLMEVLSRLGSTGAISSPRQQVLPGVTEVVVGAEASPAPVGSRGDKGAAVVMQDLQGTELNEEELVWDEFQVRGQCTFVDHLVCLVYSMDNQWSVHSQWHPFLTGTSCSSSASCPTPAV